MVGVTGFEPATTCSQSRYATRLRYTPTSDEYERWPRICPGGVGVKIVLMRHAIGLGLKKLSASLAARAR